MGRSPAQDETLPRPAVTIRDAVEEGQHVLVATVTLDGSPVEGAQVSFFVERTFGLLALGREETLDDGTSAVPFPEGLPGGPAGELRIVAEVAAAAGFAATRARAALSGGAVVAAGGDPFPPALWSPTAPWALILAAIVLFGGVWGTLGYVLVQIVRIRRGGST